jgi:hypothetical protein
MIQKVVNKRDLRSFSSIKEDLSYWLGKTPEERVAAVDYLRMIQSIVKLVLNIVPEELPPRERNQSFLKET